METRKGVLLEAPSPVEETGLEPALENLDEVQEELDVINEEASDRVFKLEQEKNKILRPMYDRRDEIISSIPRFWSTVFLNHPVLRDLLSYDDEEAIRFLEVINVKDFTDETSGYSISFTFRQNPYFEDRKLTKTFLHLNEGTTIVSGTRPKWKRGMDLTKRGSSSQEATIYQRQELAIERCEKNFFRWFDEVQEVESVQDNIADLIKDDLWSDPLKYVYAG